MIPSLDAARERFGAAVESRLEDALRGTGLLPEMTHHHMSSGGKRLRALLPPWVAENLAAGAGEEALDLGVALELLHNATLVHDDVQDGDRERRGRPALWTLYGTAQAINAGDALYFLGMSALARAPAGPRLLASVSAALVRVIEGQVMEFQLQ